MKPGSLPLQPGAPAPWFRQRCTSHPDYSFDTTAGRYILMCFFGSAAHAVGQRALALTVEQRGLFDDKNIAFFGVSVDPDDERAGRVIPSLPGIRHFWDFDGRISRLYGALPGSPGDSGRLAYRPLWVILNPNLQVRCVIPFAGDGSEQAEVLDQLMGMPPVDRFAGIELHAPVLQVPDVFEPGFCRTLIGAYERHGGQASGFVLDAQGLTRTVQDSGHKVRRDHLLDDPALREQVDLRICRSVLPAIERTHHFEVAYIERYLVGCYDAADGGHFRPHRDNTTRGTAHRRFALSINLNDDFEGGELKFPEFGPHGYRLPIGAAVVFSCSLLHAVEPVRRGRRFAFLPFLHDHAAERVRDANRGFVDLEGLPGLQAARGTESV